METKMNQREAIVNEFKELCKKADKTWETMTRGAPDLEPDLLAILEFTKKNLKHRDILVDCFVELVYDRTIGPFEIIVFCMRELQWEEIKEAAIAKCNKTHDPRVHAVMDDILEVYEPEWEFAEIYKYYAEKENVPYLGGENPDA